MDNNGTVVPCQSGEKTESSFPPGLRGDPIAEWSGKGDAERGSLLYLYSNNSIGAPEDVPRKFTDPASYRELTPYHKKQAHTVYLNADRFVCMAPSLAHVGFLTITTPDNCTDPKDLGKRWDSFNTNFLKKSPDYIHHLGVKERQSRGALHLHLLTQHPQDIRTGFDWDSYLEAARLKKEHKPWRHIAAKCYRSATPYLAERWAELRLELPKYGFGRSELLPIRTTVEAVARYVGGYLGKHIGNREERDKGMRFTFSDQGWAKNSTKFQFHTEGSAEWRRKLALFADVVGAPDMFWLKYRLGPNWAFKYNDMIQNIDEWVQTSDKPIMGIRDGSLVDLRTGEVLY